MDNHVSACNKIMIPRNVKKRLVLIGVTPRLEALAKKYSLWANLKFSKQEGELSLPFLFLLIT